MSKKKKDKASAEKILAATLDLAAEAGWDNLRLRNVARELGVPMTAVLSHYRDLDAVANAWFTQGLAAMLAPVDKGFHDLPPKERVRLLMLRWFDALAPHRETTAAMLAGKMYPFHPHHWVPMVFDLSRLIHWLRDAAGLDAGGRQKQAEEIALSALFVATLAVWCSDGSEDQARTRAFLDKRLAHGDRFMAALFGAKKEAA